MLTIVESFKYFYFLIKVKKLVKLDLCFIKECQTNNRSSTLKVKEKTIRNFKINGFCFFYSSNNNFGKTL